MTVVYDVETYPNHFSLAATSLNRDDMHYWEYSHWRDDRVDLLSWLTYLQDNQIDMIGFNNLGFDYNIIHLIMNGGFAHDLIMRKVDQIINNQNQFPETIWKNHRHIPQIDIFKINHYDNIARATSLKHLEFSMRMENICNLPIAPGTILTREQSVSVKPYNCHDVTATKKAAILCKEKIDFRRDLLSSGQLDGDVMNFSDSKIGKQIVIQRLGEDACYERDNYNRKIPRQTHRRTVAISQIIFPYINFVTPAFQKIENWFRSQVLTQTKGAIQDLETQVNGFVYHYGTGGIHGSVSREKFVANADFMIADIDVKAMYPTIEYKNGLYPEHLGPNFVKVLESVVTERDQHKKGTSKNAALKLGGNSVYGDSNNPNSPFFDWRFTMATTVNGQLLISMLAEKISAIHNARIIQVNTDGLTVWLPRARYDEFKEICDYWERLTKLTLEFNNYSRMWIRDVNNYSAEFENGKIKHKGAYEYEITVDWMHKNWSETIVARAVEMHHRYGVSVRDAILSWPDPYDFMSMVKSRGKSKFMIGDIQQGKVTRLYVSKGGGVARTMSPPVEGVEIGWFKKNNNTPWDTYLMNDPLTYNPKYHTKIGSKYENRITSYCAGWLVTKCNDMSTFNHSNVDFDYYIAEAEKLVIK